MKKEPLYKIILHDPKFRLKAFIIIDSLKQFKIAGGGIRIAQDVTIEEVERLARAMTYKLALIGSPIAGAKCGIVADPNDNNINNILKSFARLAKPILENIYIPGTDIGSTLENLELIYNEVGIDKFFIFKRNIKILNLQLYKNIFFKLQPFIGKFLNVKDDFEMQLGGMGVVASIEAACDVLDINLEKSTISIQGFGAIGSVVAKTLYSKGAKIIAVADIKGTIINKDHGLQIDKMLKYKNSYGVVDRSKLDFPFIEKTNTDEWLKVCADIIIPAATSDVINKENCKEINAKLCVQAANIPITEDAEKTLNQRKIWNIPDIVSNVGTAGIGIALTRDVSLNKRKISNEIFKRIRENTKVILNKSIKTGLPTREIAEAMAEKIINVN